MTTRTFEDKPAVRERVPVLVGLMGASGSGKTFSALRLATGMQRVSGGDVFVIDTEARRATHYADKFKFRHIDFKAPFAPDDYLSAIEHCVKNGARVVVVDSLSHEHEGPGGVLEWHERELDRMAGDDFGKRNRMTFAAWAKPKAARRKLINTIVQLGVNAVFCFRAKPKLKIERGKDPIDMGWMPIAGDEFLYEMTACCLLYPGSSGVPTWQPTMPGEKAMTKLPEQFVTLLSRTTPTPLSESIGEALAKWGEGDADQAPAKPAEAPPEAPPIEVVLEEIAQATTPKGVLTVGAKFKSDPWNTEQRARIKAALDARMKDVKAEGSAA